MCKFHYDYMKPKYLENINLCYMDTDVKTNDVYDDIRNDIPTHFVTYAYSKGNAYE